MYIVQCTCTMNIFDLYSTKKADHTNHLLRLYLFNYQNLGRVFPLSFCDISKRRHLFRHFSKKNGTKFFRPL